MLYSMSNMFEDIELIGSELDGGLIVVYAVPIFITRKLGAERVIDYFSGGSLFGGSISSATDMEENSIVYMDRFPDFLYEEVVPVMNTVEQMRELVREYREFFGGNCPEIVESMCTTLEKCILREEMLAEDDD